MTTIKRAQKIIKNTGALKIAVQPWWRILHHRIANQQEFMTLMNNKAVSFSKTIELPGDK